MGDACGVEIKDQIKALAADVGYVACGIASAEPFEDYRAALDERMRRFPEAAPLYADLAGRADPRKGAPWVRAIIVGLRRYGKYDLPTGLVGHIGRTYLCDRRARDCPEHDMPARMKAGLKGLGLRVRVGGVPCRAAAVRAGVAWIGRNGFAYSRDHGSWINIEAWRVDAELVPDEPAGPAPCPPDCRACQAACPTGALAEPYIMRMDRCVAHLTYAAPDPVPPELAAKMGGWVYGCDVCQQVCPMNRGKWEALERASWLDRVADKLTPESLATMDADTYKTVVHPLFWYIDEEDIARWHDNARRALARGGRHGH